MGRVERVCSDGALIVLNFLDHLVYTPIMEE
jgi:hypothetical protein